MEKGIYTSKDTKFSLEIVKSIRMEYNTTEEFCDNSQKFSVERRNG